MASETAPYQAVEVQPAPGHGHEAEAQPMRPEPIMMVLTWVTFAIVAFILYKVAWKPILAGLDKRESDIREALRNAERAREELAKVKESSEQLLAEARSQAQDMAAAARLAAAEAAAGIQAEARQEAQRLVEGARTEIDSATNRARETLRRDAADLAVGIAARILQEHMDEPKSRAIADRLVREV